MDYQNQANAPALTSAELQKVMLAMAPARMTIDQMSALANYREPPPFVPEGWQEWFRYGDQVP